MLRAGAAYVPVDPAYPADRVAHTARDAGLRVVITRLPGFPEVAGCAPVTPDELFGAAAEPGDASALPAVAPDAAAYVIYTSGSTGRPKGVEVPHRNVIALVDATRDEYGFGTDDVWTWFHSGAFDFSVWEIWGCLLTGGRLVVVPYFVSREPDSFRDLLVSEKVSVLSQTPSAFAQLLHVDHTRVGVRLVVFGGEPLDEIRTVLLEDPDVRSAAVVVRRDDPADVATSRIDAYVVLTGGAPSTVRKRAAGILPDYMLPTTVTALDSLPLTANGKLDTPRLPTPVAPVMPARNTETVTDGNLTDRLREIWSEVLGRPVGLDDDFFELGGNSLFAVPIGAALRARGLPSLRLRELYHHPTIRDTVSHLASSDV